MHSACVLAGRVSARDARAGACVSGLGAARPRKQQECRAAERRLARGRRGRHGQPCAAARRCWHLWPTEPSSVSRNQGSSAYFALLTSAPISGRMLLITYKTCGNV
eukprot:5430226-Pleurochrysis_carterae.AAC.5